MVDPEVSVYLQRVLKVGGRGRQLFTGLGVDQGEGVFVGRAVRDILREDFLVLRLVGKGNELLAQGLVRRTLDDGPAVDVIKI